MKRHNSHSRLWALHKTDWIFCSLLFKPPETVPGWCDRNNKKRAKLDDIKKWQLWIQVSRGNCVIIKSQQIVLFNLKLFRVVSRPKRERHSGKLFLYHPRPTPLPHSGCISPGLKLCGVCSCHSHLNTTNIDSCDSVFLFELASFRNTNNCYIIKLIRSSLLMNIVIMSGMNANNENVSLQKGFKIMHEKRFVW